MTLYRVVDYKGKDCIYEGFDKEVALKMCHDYNECCGDWYLEEIDLPDEDEIARVDFDDLKEMDEYVSDYLSNEYGYCVKSFKYDFDIKKIYIYDIEWDTSE